jgi:hypothetical protein
MCINRGERLAVIFVLRFMLLWSDCKTRVSDGPFTWAEGPLVYLGSTVCFPWAYWSTEVRTLYDVISSCVYHYLPTPPRLGPQGDSVNSIKNLNKEIYIYIIWLWYDISLTDFNTVYAHWCLYNDGIFRSVDPTLSYVSVYYTMMDS